MLMLQIVHNDDEEERENEIGDGHCFEFVAGSAHLHPWNETEEERGQDLQCGRKLLSEASDCRDEELCTLGLMDSASCVRIQSPWEER